MKRTNAVLLIIFATLFSFLLVGLKYEGSSTDSTIYNKFVEQLAAKPFKEIMNPEWRDINPYFSKDEPTPYVRDHYPGQFLIPTLFAKMGYPASHVLYLFNIFYKLIYLFLLYFIISHFVPKKDASFILYGAFFSILSFNYFLRSDHEQPLLVFSLLSVLSGLKFQNNKKWFWGLFLASGGAFFVKGLATFYVPAFGLLSFYISSGFKKKELFLICLSALSIPLVIGLYEIYFRLLTGLPFFEGYWKVQLSGRTLNQGSFSLISKVANFGYYLSRGLIYSLPWSLVALIFWLLKKREGNQRLYLLLLSLSFFIYLGFSLFNRTASRYVYVGNFLLGILCILYVYFNSKTLLKFHQKILKYNIWTVMILTWGSVILLALGFWIIRK